MDIDKIRADIPTYGNKIFLDSAGSSLMPKSVVPAICEYLKKEELLGGYRVEKLQEKVIDNFYIQTAKLLGCQPHNIAFAHDATDAYIKALSSIPFEKDDLIITTNSDYASNQIQFISLKKRYGIRIARIQNLENGDLDIQHFQELIHQQRPKLVAVTHIPTNSGMIQDVEAIGDICHRHEITFLVDACQSVGQIDVNVGDIKCDFLSATGRKFLRGPRGTGILFVSDRVIHGGYTPLMVDGRGATWTAIEAYEVLLNATRFQTWEAPYALIVGFAEALRYCNEIGIQNIEKYNKDLMQHLRQNLTGIPGVEVFDRGTKTSNILTFRKKEHSLEDIKNELDKHNIFSNISSKEWGLIDYGQKGIDGTIRISPHYFNTIEEMDRVSEIIDNI